MKKIQNLHNIEIDYLKCNYYSRLITPEQNDDQNKLLDI